MDRGDTDMTFEDIISFCPTNQGVFDDVRDLLPSIIPFIGAGMSIPIYNSWSSLLVTLSKNIMDDRAEFDSAIRNNCLVEAAQLLEDKLGPTILADELLRCCNSKKIRQNRLLPKMTVNMLPALFPTKPVITTNYDRVLETVYSDHEYAFDNVFGPSQEQLSTQTFQRDRHSLFKIHGDIGTSHFAYNDIIFTVSQYNKAYQENTPLYKALSDFMGGKVLLFLGCSLEKDRVLDVLRTVASNKDIRHYAFLSCDKDSLTSKNKMLSNEYNIRAVYYPNGQHEAVRILLDHLKPYVDTQVHYVDEREAVLSEEKEIEELVEGIKAQAKKDREEFLKGRWVVYAEAKWKRSNNYRLASLLMLYYSLHAENGDIEARIKARGLFRELEQNYLDAPGVKGALNGVRNKLF